MITSDSDLSQEEVCVGFEEVIPDFNSTLKGALVASKAKSYISLSDGGEVGVKENPLSILLKRDRYDSLSEEAKYIIHLVLTTPMEIVGITGSITKQRIWEYLRSQEAWTWKTIWGATDELKSFVSNF